MEKLTLPFVVCFILALGMKCEKEDPRDIAYGKVNEVAKISLVEYDVSKIVFAHKTKWLASDATFVAKSEATVSLGFDVNKFDSNAVVIQADKITVRFPPIVMIDFDYPAEKFMQIEKYSKNCLFNKFSSSSRDAAFQLAEEDIRKQIEYIDLRKRVEDNARAFLEPILTDLGYTPEQIHIEFAPR